MADESPIKADESPLKDLAVVLAVVIVSSLVVSGTVVALRDIRAANEALERGRHVAGLTGLLDVSGKPTDDQIRAVLDEVDVRAVDIDLACFAAGADTTPVPGSVAIPANLDSARLGTRPARVDVFLVWRGGSLDRIILPVEGAGMWSRLAGYVALESDLETIAAAVFHEQAETPGLGDQITRPDWLATWAGKRVYDRSGEVRFAIASGRVDPGASTAVYEVDALSGATVTADAVSGLVGYWFGEHGYKPFLRWLSSRPLVRDEDRACEQVSDEVPNAALDSGIGDDA